MASSSNGYALDVRDLLPPRIPPAQAEAAGASAPKVVDPTEAARAARRRPSLSPLPSTQDPELEALAEEPCTELLTLSI